MATAAKKIGSEEGRSPRRRPAEAKVGEAGQGREDGQGREGAPRPRRRRRASPAGTLVVVESPAKAKTIKKYLGRSYEVMASVGHIRDLPKSKLGVDVENGFEPEYVVIRGKTKVVADIKKAARNAEPDPARHRPRPRGRGHRLAPRQELGAPGRRRPGPARPLQRDHQGRHPGRHREARASSTARSSTASRPAASSTGWWATRSAPSSGRRCGAASPPAACSRWPCAWWWSASGRSRPSSQVEYWTLDADLAAALPPEFRARLVKVDGQKADAHRRRHGPRPRRRDREGPLHGGRGRTARSAAATRPRPSPPPSSSRRPPTGSASAPRRP